VAPSRMQKHAFLLRRLCWHDAICVGIAPSLSASCKWRLHFHILGIFAKHPQSCNTLLGVMMMDACRKVAPSICQERPGLRWLWIPQPIGLAHCVGSDAKALWWPFRKVDCTTSVHCGRLATDKHPLTGQCTLCGLRSAFAQETGPGTCNTSLGTWEWNTRVMFLPWWPAVFMHNSSAIAKNLSSGRAWQERQWAAPPQPSRVFACLIWTRPTAHRPSLRTGHAQICGPSSRGNVHPSTNPGSCT